MRWWVIPFLAIGLTVSDPAIAGNKGGKAKGKNKAHPYKSEQLVASLITALEVSIIRNFVQEHRSSPPPAFAGAKSLPPGIAKKVARGDRLPPGIAKQYFPADLTARLPHRPGERWLVTGKDIVLLEAATGFIVDILHDAF